MARLFARVSLAAALFCAAVVSTRPVSCVQLGDSRVVMAGGGGDDDDSSAAGGGGAPGGGGDGGGGDGMMGAAGGIPVDGKWLCTRMLPALAAGRGSYCNDDPLGSKVDSTQCLAAAECIVSYSNNKDGGKGAGMGPGDGGGAANAGRASAPSSASSGRLTPELTSCARSPSCVARVCSAITSNPCYRPALTPFHFSDLTPSVKVHYIKQDAGEIAQERERIPEGAMPAQQDGGKIPASAGDVGIGPAVGSFQAATLSRAAQRAGALDGPALKERVSHVKSHPE